MNLREKVVSGLKHTSVLELNLFAEPIGKEEMITKELRQLHHEMTTKYDQGFDIKI